MMRNYVFSEITFVGIFVNEIHGEVEEETFEMERKLCAIRSSLCNDER